MSEESSMSVLDKSALNDFLDELIGTGQVFAPVLRDQILCMAPVEGADEIVPGLETLVRQTIARQASKEIYMPRTETLFAYRDGKYIPPVLLEEPRIVFAVRPCDARAVALLDHVFDGGPDAEPGAASVGDRSYQDPYFMARRKNTLMIGLACNRPLSTCFCTSVGGGPFSTDGLDLLWTDLGDRYLVEAVTEQGKSLLADSPHMREAGSEDLGRKAELAARAQEAVAGPDVTGVKEKLDRIYDSPFWEKVHLSCLGCGACTYLCPTCHCFDIQDEGNRGEGRRVRNWDTCQFAQFTLHASGHNPRTSGKERMRQRIMHKFNYFVENFDAIACVGCGRCVRECPVNLDIRAVLSGVKEAEEV
jgi:sulfhydrogenase subunit beta (sulfur reductase)